MKDDLTKLDLIFKLNKLFINKSLEDLCKEIHELLREVTGYENFYVALIDRTNDYLYFVYYFDEYDKKLLLRKLFSRVGLSEYVLIKN